jgi:surface polysaccharide O-acyltransferase-like enzyme
MPRVSAAFFVTGGLFVLMGMFGGMWMGMNEDFRLMPVHAHLNLLGWVTMALYGGFYALTAKTYSKRLAWTNYALSTVGVIVMIPLLAVFLLTQNKALTPFMGIGELISVSSLVVFLISAVRELIRRRPALDAEASDVDPVRLAAE